MKKSRLTMEARILKTALNLSGIHIEDETVSLVAKINAIITAKDGDVGIKEIVSLREQNDREWEEYVKEDKKISSEEEKEEKVDAAAQA